MVFVYVSGNRKELVGAFEVAGIIEGAPESLWGKVRRTAAVSRELFDEYFEDAAKAIGIRVGAVTTFPKPVPLARLRKNLPGFHPPQGFRYLSSSDIKKMR